MIEATKVLEDLKRMIDYRKIELNNKQENNSQLENVMDKGMEIAFNDVLRMISMLEYEISLKDD